MLSYLAQHDCNGVFGGRGICSCATQDNISGTKMESQDKWLTVSNVRDCIDACCSRPEVYFYIFDEDETHRQSEGVCPNRVPNPCAVFIDLKNLCSVL